MREFVTVLFLILSVGLVGCVTQSSPAQGGAVEDLLTRRGVITLPLVRNDNKLMVVIVGYGEGQSGRFVVDTGATRTAIYKRTKNRLSSAVEAEETLRIYGMFETGLQSAARLSVLELGGERFENHFVAVLDDPKQDQSGAPQIDGLIGMDVLANYRLYVDGPSQTLNLLPLSLGPVILPQNWRVIELTANPFLEEDRLLHFMQIRVGNIATQALLDTGSEFSLLNWNTAKIPELRRLRKKLRSKWELEGAIGTFEPVSKVLVKRFRAGQYVWPEHNFIVLDFKTLNVLGIEDQPFIIAGADLFIDKSYLIDFELNAIRVKPEKTNVNPANVVVNVRP